MVLCVCVSLSVSCVKYESRIRKESKMSKKSSAHYGNGLNGIRIETLGRYLRLVVIRSFCAPPIAAFVVAMGFYSMFNHFGHCFLMRDALFFPLGN